jgi:hypothetical protein
MMLWWFFSGIQTEARAVKDYRPISLIDSFGKLMSKVLANQLATRIGDLVHPSQSFFIARQNYTRFLHDGLGFSQDVACQKRDQASF